MRVCFLGTPDFAVESLKAIINSSHEVVGVFTQPDKPVGRKAILTPSKVKSYALSQGLKVFAYEKISRDGIDDLKSLNCDIIVTCAFGQILSKEVLDIARLGVINVHASLLPKYRGASPIQQAVLNGDSETGVTIMQTDVSLDSGDIILQEKVEILPDETTGELFDRLSLLGAKLIVRALDELESGNAKFIPQQHENATFVKQIKKSDAKINWAKPKSELYNFVRGMQPWPCAFTAYNGKILKIFKIQIEEDVDDLSDFDYGQVVCVTNKEIKVKCLDGIVSILELQLEGGKRMTSESFLLGRRVAVGEYLK